MTGNSVPPQLEPKAMAPNAAPFLRLNQCATTATIGPNVNPENIYGHSDRQRTGRFAGARRTHTNGEPLTEEELPVNGALSDQQR